MIRVVYLIEIPRFFNAMYKYLLKLSAIFIFVQQQAIIIQNTMILVQYSCARPSYKRGRR